MDDQNRNGGPAFPRPISTDYSPEPCNVAWDAEGMSLRDWFAGRAVQAMLFNSQGDAHNGHALAARLAYQVADAMLKAREE